MDTSEASSQRRSVKAFDPTHRLPASEETRLFAAAIQSPTSLNMQNWRFVVVRDTELRKRIQAAAVDQAQSAAASLLIVLTAHESPPVAATLTDSLWKGRPGRGAGQNRRSSFHNR